MFSLVSFVGMTLDKCAVLQIGKLAGAFTPVQGESPPVQVKEPYSGLHDYLQAFILQNWCVQCAAAHNPLKKV